MTAEAQPGTDNGSSPELSILMPCLNEAETLETCIRKAQTFLDRHQVRGEVVVADNGSTDGSQVVARRCGARVVAVPVLGYGAALFYGTLAARGKYVIMGDSDDSYDFSSLMPFLEKLRAGWDLVVGNRFLGGIKPGAMPWKNRWLGTPVLSGISHLFFQSPIWDLNCGLRGFSQEAFKKMDLRTTGMEFASEMVIKATMLGMKIVEVPTTLSPDRRSRPPHLRPWRDGWRHFRFMLLYSPRWLFLYPGILLMMVGLMGGVWLLPGPRTVGGLTFDVHTLLYMAVAVLLGFQAIAFAIFAKVFAVSEGLLPPDSRLDGWFRYFALEAGLIIGGILMILGLAASILALSTWGQRHFGALDVSQTMRLVIPAVLLLTLGVQICLSSFFFSVLRLRRR